MEETNKKNATIEEIVKAFQEDLVQITLQANAALAWGYQRDSLLRLVEIGQATREMYLLHPEMRSLITRVFPFNLAEENLNSLLNVENDVNSKYKQLYSFLKTYKRKIDGHKQGWEATQATSRKNVDFLFEHLPWCDDEGNLCDSTWL